jgi:dienelactone hydrolase
MTNPTVTIEIPTGDDKPVWADLYAPGAETGPFGSIVILCHGLKGYRRWGFIPQLARSLGDAGIAAVAIDFSHNGVAGGDGGLSGGPVYPAPELFRDNTLDRERNDLAAVIRWVRQGAGGRAGKTVRPGLWGHSRGGGSVVLNALARPEDISAIVTWSAPAQADIYRPGQKKRWREAGEYDFLEGVSGERLAMGIGYLDDLEARHEEYALADRAGDLAVPHLVVHGELDLVIPAESADQFYAAAPARAEKQILKLRTGHTFGIARSPRSGPLLEAINATREWFRRFTLEQGENE